jgi:hypothetical protein
MGSMQKPDGSLRREETSAGSLQKPHLKLRLIPMRIHKRSVSLSRQAGRPFVALSRFCRWFQGVHKRSARLCDRFRRFDHQKVCHFVAAVAAGGQAFCCD